MTERRLRTHEGLAERDRFKKKPNSNIDELQEPRYGENIIGGNKAYAIRPRLWRKKKPTKTKWDA